MKPVFHQCTRDDLDELIEIGIETYSDTFSAMNTPENMEDYLASAFNREKMREELANEDSSFWFLTVDGELAGYLKTNVGKAQTDLGEDEGLEIERIYMRRQFQRRGLGTVMIEKGIEMAREIRKTYAWLGVWERNESAIVFYERMGFRKIGTHPFTMGDDVQTDFIMRKEIDKES